MQKTISMPLDEIEVLDGELVLVHGGNTDSNPDGTNGVGSGCSVGSGCNCFCGILCDK